MAPSVFPSTQALGGPLVYSLQHRLLGTGFHSGRGPKAVVETPQRGLYKGLIRGQP